MCLISYLNLLHNYNKPRYNVVRSQKILILILPKIHCQQVQFIGAGWRILINMYKYKIGKVLFHILHVTIKILNPLPTHFSTSRRNRANGLRLKQLLHRDGQITFIWRRYHSHYADFSYILKEKYGPKLGTIDYVVPMSMVGKENTIIYVDQQNLKTRM